MGQQGQFSRGEQNKAVIRQIYVQTTTVLATLVPPIVMAHQIFQERDGERLLCLAVLNTMVKRRLIHPVRVDLSKTILNLSLCVTPVFFSTASLLEEN